MMGIKRKKVIKDVYLLIENGMLLSVNHYPANRNDSKIGDESIEELNEECLIEDIKDIYVDNVFGGEFTKRCNFYGLNVIQYKKDSKSEKKSFILHPKRWVVERCFAWTGNFRRLNLYYERNTSSANSFCYLAMIKYY